MNNIDNEPIVNSENDWVDFYLSYMWQKPGGISGYWAGYIFGYKLGKLSKDRIDLFCQSMEQEGWYSRICILAISKL